MCGICGIYNLDKLIVDKEKLRDMTKIVNHRGLDDEGYLLIITQNNELGMHIMMKQ